MRPILRSLIWANAARIFAILAVILGVIHYLPLPFLPVPWLLDLHNDLAPELIGIGITVILIEWALRKQSKEERKAQLIRQLRSKYRDVTEMARIELEHEGWLKDGSLRGAHLMGARLDRAVLERADLKYTILWKADLSGAFLWEADLRGAILNKADLRGADLRRANLSGVDLREADLSEAILREADLRGADLRQANLRGAILKGADLGEADLRGSDINESISIVDPSLWRAVIIESRTLRWARK